MSWQAARGRCCPLSGCKGWWWSWPTCQRATKSLGLFSKALMGLVWWWALTRPNVEKAFCGFPGEESAFARVEQVEDLFEESPHVTQSWSIEMVFFFFIFIRQKLKAGRSCHPVRLMQRFLWETQTKPREHSSLEEKDISQLFVQIEGSYPYVLWKESLFVELAAKLLCPRNYMICWPYYCE